jgi:hypothetical protein
LFKIGSTLSSETRSERDKAIERCRERERERERSVLGHVKDMRERDRATKKKREKEKERVREEMVRGKGINKLGQDVLKLFLSLIEFERGGESIGECQQVLPLLSLCHVTFDEHVPLFGNKRSLHSIDVTLKFLCQRTCQRA